MFDNDFAALKPETAPDRFERDGLLIAESEPGICRVVCFSPKHNLTMANMEAPDLRKVVDRWVEQYPIWAHARHQLRADFREPRRHDGKLESPSPLPDLVQPRDAE